jgi:predicted nucleic acid-binding protein
LIPLVVDASVAVKWCLPMQEEGALTAEAEELLASYRNGDVEFVVPDLFWLEVANALWKSVRKQKIDQTQAELAYALVVELAIPTVPSFANVPKALDLAISHDRTVYDSIYVALALQFKTSMVTADERLANALAAYLPVKWLGSL